jgi:exodeoxyribonuclease-3
LQDELRAAGIAVVDSREVTEAERAWLDTLFRERGWVDSYRHLRPEGEDYTWWSNRGQARKKNVGWRIDYQIVTPDLRTRLKTCDIAHKPRFSDHAPYLVDYHVE